MCEGSETNFPRCLPPLIAAARRLAPRSTPPTMLPDSRRLSGDSTSYAVCAAVAKDDSSELAAGASLGPVSYIAIAIAYLHYSIDA